MNAVLLRIASPVRDVPVDPDVDQAREWITRELAKPPYRAAEPTWFDRLASGFWEWLTSLQFGGSGSPLLMWGLVALLVIGALVAAYFVFGPPRLNRRAGATGLLFGADDQRTDAALRRSAAEAAARGDAALAIEEMFRATARGLAERAIVDTFPGTTARAFAASAGTFFSTCRDALTASAHDFDDVRYLDRPGTEAAYRRMLDLDAALQAMTPDLMSDPVPDPVPVPVPDIASTASPAATPVGSPDASATAPR